MKRCREDIVGDILELCIEPSSRSNLVHQGHLNFSTISSHMGRLVSAGFLETFGTRPTVYKTTPKGMEMLEHIKASMDLLGQF